jgi:hypothetical protein
VLLQAVLTAVLSFGHPRFRFTAEMLFVPYAAYALHLLARRLGVVRRPA